MRTLVISDLHLGAAQEQDILRRAEVRARLLEAVRGVDRLVILGDGLELRDGPRREVAAIAGPVFADLGRALGGDGELVLLAGNHDHGLVAVEPSPDLERWFEPQAASPLALALAERAAPARVRVAYPGAWLRADVYATHGHYSDLHTTVPMFERLAAGAMARFVVPVPEEGATPDHYEAALSPLYAWLHAVAQRPEHSRLAAGAGASARAWVALSEDGRARRAGAGLAGLRGSLRGAVLGGGLAAAIAAVNAAGIGPVDRDLSGPALRRGGLRGMAEALRRLGVAAPHVIFGHTHRSGPWPADDLAEWAAPGGGRLHNTGSWVHQPHFAHAAPYRPGTAIMLEGDAPPRLLRLVPA